MTNEKNSKFSKTIAQQLNITEFPFEIRDENGALIYYENEDGTWEKKETKTIAEQLGIKKFPFEIKDKNGNTIYIEREDGSWEISKYDEEGKQVFHQNQNGFWAEEGHNTPENKRVLDEIFYENSEGVIIDNQPK